jgi:predicted N-acetyltransferase YhbS
MPEIHDLRVAERYRRRGVGAALIRRCERLARRVGHTGIGLGVGLHAGYGAAQRLYMRLGYLPDGRGVSSGNATALPGALVRLDDQLLLWLQKPLAPHLASPPPPR